jgi:hypothetical protein
MLTAPPPVDSESIAKAREALRQKLAEMEAQPPAGPGVLAQPTPGFEPVPAAVPAADAQTIAKARAAMEQKMKELPAEAPAVAKPAAQPFLGKPSNLKGAPGFPPIQGPPPAVSAEKQARLDALLRQYRADQITPLEYQQQRAKIIADP